MDKKSEDLIADMQTFAEQSLIGIKEIQKVPKVKELKNVLIRTTIILTYMLTSSHNNNKHILINTFYKEFYCAQKMLRTLNNYHKIPNWDTIDCAAKKIKPSFAACKSDMALVETCLHNKTLKEPPSVTFLYNRVKTIRMNVLELSNVVNTACIINRKILLNIIDYAQNALTDLFEKFNNIAKTHDRKHQKLSAKKIIFIYVSTLVCFCTVSDCMRCIAKESACIGADNIAKKADYIMSHIRAYRKKIIDKYYEPFQKESIMQWWYT